MAVPSLASDLLQQNDEEGGGKEKEKIIKEAAATTFSGESSPLLPITRSGDDYHKCSRRRYSEQP
jgi:hypothetical protein